MVKEIAGVVEWALSLRRHSTKRIPLAGVAVIV